LAVALVIFGTVYSLRGLGAATGLFTGRKMAFSTLRQLAVGLAAALVTFLLGHLIAQLYLAVR